jgi:DNA ligase-1
MLKVKKFIDAEYKVVDAVMGPIRFIDNGKEVEEEMLSAVTIKHKGYDVSVGSGFSMDFRRAAYKDPSLIVGKTVTVCYFEETTNKQGTISLRFPTVKTIYDGERDV